MNKLEKVSTWDGLSYSLMVGLGESFLPAFVLAMGFSEIESGLIATLPILSGAVLQLLSPYMVSRLRSFRKWVVICAVFQALSFLPLCFSAAWPHDQSWILFLAAGLYWAAGLSSEPAWNAWMGNLIPLRRRGKFWTLRSRVVHTGALIGFVGGGYVLYLAEPTPLRGFLTIFIAAMLLRLLSAFWLSKHGELRKEDAFRTSRLLGGLEFILRSNSGKFVRFMCFFYFASFISAPFFSPFMLVELKLNYFEYTVLIAAALMAKVLASPFLHGWMKKRGSAEVIWGGAVGATLLPVLWLVSENFLYLLSLQLLAGFAWAGMELALPLLVLEAADEGDRIGVFSVFNLGRAISVSFGSIVGACLFDLLGTQWSSYETVYVLSTVFRALCLLVLMSIPLASFPVLASAGKLFWRITSIRASVGSIERPVVDHDPTR